jgi:hypothetical protein
LNDDDAADSRGVEPSPVSQSAVAALLKGRHFWLLLTEVIVLVPLIIYYFPCLTGERSFYASDLTWYFQPFLSFMSNCFGKGELPLWNPYMYCGMAQFAVPSPGIFYPFNFYFYIMPFSPALALFLITHQVVAGIGAFLLVLSLGWGGFAALVAALACAWCGYMFSMTSNFTLMATIAWLPLAVFCVRRVRGEFSLRNMLSVVSTALVVFMMVAAGRPEVSVPAAIVLAVFAVADVVARYRDDRLARAAFQQVGWRAAAGCLGIVLAMPVILPALEWTQVSPRASGMDPKYVFMWSANWYDWLCVILPQPFGDVSELGSKFLQLTASRAATIPYLPSAFVGPVILVLAIWGLCDRSWPGRWLVVGIGIMSAIMALGQFTPLAPALVSTSPALSSFRYPVKLMIIPVLCLILLAARGAYLSHHRWVGWRSFIATLVLCLLGMVAGAVFVLSPGLSQLAISNPYFSTRIANLTDLTEAQSLLGGSLLVMSAVGAGICLIYFALLRRKLPRMAFAAVVVFTQGLLLLYAPMHYSRRYTAGDFYTRAVPLADEIKKLCGAKSDGSFTWRVQTLCYDPLMVPAEFPRKCGLPFQEAYYQYGRQMQITNTHLPFALPYSFGYEAAESGVYKELYDSCLWRSSNNRFHETKRKDDLPLANFCRYTSTRFLWTQAWLRQTPVQALPHLSSSVFRLLKEDIDNNLRIYECADVLPRCYFATGIAWKETVQDIKAAIVDGPDAATTFLEAGTADEAAVGECSLTNERGEEVVLESQALQRMQVRTKSPHQRLLILNDHLYSGWSARVDGQPVPVFRANAFARAVVVPAGHHRVVFEFASPSLQRALYILLAGLTLMIVLIVTTTLRKR